MKVKKGQLKVGMWLRNTRSNRNGEVLGDPKNPKKLRRSHRTYVAVLTGPSGRVAAFKIPRVALWHLPNVSMIG